jgi:Sel1 repeat
MTMLAAIIAAVSAIAAVAGAVISNRNMRAMRSAYVAIVSAQKPSDRTLPVIVGITNRKMRWVRSFLEAGAPLGIVLTIFFSLVLGVAFKVLLSRNNSPSAPVPVFNFAEPARTTPVSAPPFTTAAAAEPASIAPVWAPPLTTTAAAEPASTAPVSAPPLMTTAAAEPASTAPVSAPPFTTAAAVEPASAPPVSAPLFATAATAEPNRSEAAALLAHGRAKLSNGEIAGARMFLSKAAEYNDPQAALALGESYDPAVLKDLGVFKFNGDVALARAWYRRAADLGSAAAVSRLGQLSKTDQAAEPASTASVSAAPFAAAATAEPDRNEAAALLARGRAKLSNGDVAEARMYLRRAAEHNDPQAALALGETYDPAVLKHLGIIKFNADLTLAREWYRRAADLGSAAAISRLDQLSKTDHK